MVWATVVVTLSLLLLLLLLPSGTVGILNTGSDDPELEGFGDAVVVSVVELKRETKGLNAKMALIAFALLLL